MFIINYQEGVFLDAFLMGYKWLEPLAFCCSKSKGILEKVRASYKARACWIEDPTAGAGWVFVWD